MNKTSLVIALALLMVPAVSYAEPQGVIERGPQYDESDPDENDIAIDLRDDVSDSDARALAVQYGLTDMAPNSPWGATRDKIQIAHVSLSDMQSKLEALRKDPRVEFAEANTAMHAAFVPNDPLYKDQWHMPKVGSESAWDYTCGRGVTVAVVDTGVACFKTGPYARISDLKGTRCEGGWNFVHDNDQAYDDEGHGTHVAGTIAQTTDNGAGVAGLAHCATIMPVKVLSSNGSGSLADVAEGIRYAADNGANIINLSLGGPLPSLILGSAVKHAINKGVLVIAAAGNSGKSIGYPAKYKGVMAVGATDSNDNIAFFSSRGPELAIAAPGVKVIQQTICDHGKNACEQFGSFSGTSMATPHVAGAAALLASLGVTDADALRSALQTSARPKGEPEKYGAGVLDVGSAVTRVYLTHVVTRVLAMFGLTLALWQYIRAKKGEFNLTAGASLAAVFAGVGLLAFAPFAHLASLARGPARLPLDLAMRPFGEWTQLLGADIHQWLPLASILPVGILVGLFFRIDRLRPSIGGFAVGTAALCTQIAITADAASPFGSLMLRLWMVAQVAVCFFVARIALDSKTSA